MRMYNREYNMTVPMLPEDAIRTIVGEMGLVCVLHGKGKATLTAMDFHSTGESAENILNGAEKFLREKGYIGDCIAKYKI